MGAINFPFCSIWCFLSIYTQRYIPRASDYPIYVLRFESTVIFNRASRIRTARRCGPTSVGTNVCSKKQRINRGANLSVCFENRDCARALIKYPAYANIIDACTCVYTYVYIYARRCRRSVNEIDTRRDSAKKLIPGHFSRNLIFQSEGILKLGIGVVNSYGVLFSLLAPSNHRNGTRRAVKIVVRDCAVILLGRRRALFALPNSCVRKLCF